ncbi:MAG TPA: VIT family protein [Caulobacteraceae bacterium]|nr:VIT family protein [Caulobacteraceae bacterium]
MPRRHLEHHYMDRIGWLRAAVLGANDGILSTGSLIIGVSSAAASHGQIVITGIAGLVSGAMSMAAGEYVSVSSQADTEKADLVKERQELAGNVAAEERELAGIYVQRGLQPDLAREVARQLMAKDALQAHARDELGISEATTARPLQAAMASAASFGAGAALPVLVAVLFPANLLFWAVAGVSLLGLAALGVVGARMGGAGVVKAVARVVFWGAVGMAVTAGASSIFGVRG